MDARIAWRRRVRSRPRRPGTRRVPRCTACARRWPTTARYCGWCGDVLDVSAVADSGAGPAGDADTVRDEPCAGRHPARPGGGAGGRADLLAVAAATLLVVAAATTPFVRSPGPSSAEEGQDVADDRVAVGSSQADSTGSDPPPTTTCEQPEHRGGGCIVPLVAHRVSHGTLSTLPPDAAVIATTGEVRLFDVGSGRLEWRTAPFDGDGELRIRAAPEGVVVSRPGEVALLDADTGDLRWRQVLPSSAARVAPRTWLVEGDVLVLDTGRTLHALDGRDGTVRWAIDDVSPDVITTADGLLLSRASELGLWRPDAPSPVWSRAKTEAGPLRLAGQRPAGTPVRMLLGQQLLVPQTGEILDLNRSDLNRSDLDRSDLDSPDLHDDVPATGRALGDITLVLRWPEPDVFELVGLGPGGAVLWERDDLEVACCLASSPEASHDRLVIGAPSGPYQLLHRSTGATLARLERPQATLEGVAGDLVLWREGEQLIVTDLTTGDEVARSSGSVRSLEPLLVAGPEGLIHLAP